MSAPHRYVSSVAIAALLALPSACADDPPGNAFAPPSFHGADTLPPPPPPPEEPVPGRMTGGGSQIIIGDVKITRGFTIHCDITLSNNIEINWPGNKWHLDKPITRAECIDDPAISPEPPPAPFDTFKGEAVGSLNGQPGSWIGFTFVDSGEPGGNNDLAGFRIYAPGGALVLDVPLGFLTKGNLQAHYDQPHGNKP
jgi:hypothetical protein